jgi:putative aldouronate transport system permease protein
MGVIGSLRKTVARNKDENRGAGIRGFFTWDVIKRDFRRNKYIYLMAVPIIAFYIIFHYIPMFGAQIAFRNFSPALGVTGSPWVGLANFENFFNSIHAWRVIRNTFLLSFYSMLWGFPAPIIFALLLNEVSHSFYKRLNQTLSYLPHFVSLVVACGLVVTFVSSDGFINDIIAFFAGDEARRNLLMNPGNFRSIFIASEIWQAVGFGSIIYLAAISGLDQESFEAAYIDGASRLRRCIHITIPGIMPTIIILLILRMGALMSVGFERVLLLYSPGVYETADVISTFVFRRGILDADWSFSAAVGLFNSVINFTLVISANWISRKFSETSLF